MQLSRAVPLSLIAIAFLPPTGMAKAADTMPKTQLLKREEMMVLNLNRGPRSARFYILESIKALKLAQSNLERAQLQVEQVDAAFAKAKGRPDDRTMQQTTDQLKSAVQTAASLCEQLHSVQSGLKESVQETLVK